ncbi:MAG: 3-deoxy-D-manno-octulosonic acid kinase [Granulosicoccus sp.]
MPGIGNTFIRVRDDWSAPDGVFDEAVLARKGWLTGKAEAGRGNTFFFKQDGQACVLRHYWRGGLARKISKQYYVWTGLVRTRAMREFSMLEWLETQGLPAPIPLAVRICRDRWRYRASLITQQLPGQTLASCLSDGKLSTEQCAGIGICIARFHTKGLWHADLNAHNILIDTAAAQTTGSIFLIDFDRARSRALPPMSASGWQRANLDRLRRSMLKCSTEPDRIQLWWQIILESWSGELVRRSG